MVGVTIFWTEPICSEEVTILFNSNMDSTVYIPVGSDCCVAYNLDRLGLRKQSLPFDWLRINSIYKIVQLIETNFQHFLDKEYLEEVDKSDKFPIVDTVWVDFNDKTHPIISNTKLGIKFYHDFEAFDDFFVGIVREKYKRRIKRFYTILDDPSIHKVFVRHTVKKKDKEVLEIFLKNSGYTNFSVVCVIPDTVGVKYSSWKKEEIDWQTALCL